MKDRLYLVLLFFLLSIYLFALPTAYAIPDSVKAQIETYAKNYATQKKCLILINVTDDNGIPFYTGYNGRTGKVQTKFDLPFEIGSCSKMFTATAILQLVEKGKLSLEDRLVKVLPNPVLYKDLLVIDGKDYIDSVKILDLLRHSSGMADYFLSPDSIEIAASADITLQYTPEQLIRRSKRLNKPFFKPGSGQFKYSNVNYILLGRIIEKLTGMKYQQYIQTFILKPLDLSNTWFGSIKRPSEELAGHFKGMPIEMPPTMAWSAGEMISTLENMNRFVRSWFAGKLFRNKTTAEMMRKDFFQSMGGMGIEYGLGNLSLSQKAWGHAGQTFGWQSFMAALPGGYSFSFGIDDAASEAWGPAMFLTTTLADF